MAPMLEVRDLHVNYGKVSAVRGLCLNVNKGEIVSVVGANGAGKSSLLNAICGICPAGSGEIMFQGKNITSKRPHEIVAAGIVQVPEGRMILGGLSVAENLMLGAHRSAGLLNRHEDFSGVLRLFPMLADRLDEAGSSLSGGQGQMLALARGLLLKPKLLLLDEPTLGLSPIAARQTFDLIARLRETGLTVLLNEQNVRQTLVLSDRAYVLEGGTVRMEGKSSELLRSRYLADTYLGIEYKRRTD